MMRDSGSVPGLAEFGELVMQMIDLKGADKAIEFLLI
jgi:hypothetical protein